MDEEQLQVLTHELAKTPKLNRPEFPRRFRAQFLQKFHLYVISL
ncbi:Uncharacterised protein [Yersinia aldovae]|nr:hypothetical protein AT01_363 [Yersinia aldovae 670-83]CNH52309.1 Uncharacterised protein [Yersinia aldovae]